MIRALQTQGNFSCYCDNYFEASTQVAILQTPRQSARHRHQARQKSAKRKPNGTRTTVWTVEEYIELSLGIIKYTNQTNSAFYHKAIDANIRNA